MRFSHRLVPATALAALSFGCASPETPSPEAEPVAASTTPAVPADPPLEFNPALTRGTLDNGFAYVVARHGTPAGRIGIWMHVNSGSLNESEEQRGLAHFLEHLAFNGSERFPPGSVVPFFQSLGLRFGSDQNAFTNYAETTYQLYLPDVRPETIDKALTFFADVASGLLLLPKEIDDERQIILEEKRARGGAQQRVRELVGERLAPESTYGRRMPIGVEDQIKRFSQDDFRDYYGRFYKPSNMTLIAAGDVDPDVVVAAVHRAFDGAPTAARPTPRPVGVQPTKGRRAIVATDPELTGCDVAMVRCAPPRAPTTATSQLRRELVETCAVRAYERRSRRLTATGGASFLESDVGIRDVIGAMTQYRVHARVGVRDWKKHLADLGVALQRARLHGFADREVEDVKTAMLSDADEAATREPSLAGRQILARMNAEVGAGEPVLSAAQRRDAMRALLPGVTTAEVSSTFADAFDPTDAVFTIEMSSAASPPSEADFLAAASAAMDAKPDAAAEVVAAPVVFAEPPETGTVAESSEHKDSGVFSAWLGNGVRVHHRLMREQKNEATISITLAAGSILETAADRGIAEAAVQAWTQPAGGAYTNTQIRDWLVGKKVHLRAGAGEDTMNLTVSGDPADLEDGMRLAYLLLTEPVVDRRAVGQWKGRVRQGIAQRKVQPAGLLGETVDDAFFGKDEVRKRAIDAAQLDKIRSPAVQTWLRRTTTASPMEVAVVGDIERRAAMALVVKYLGALPPRPRIGADTLEALRVLTRPKGPIEVAKSFDLQTPEAFVYAGFFGADARDLDDARRLEIAARVVTTRMIAEIRERRQLVYSVRSESAPAVVFPGFGAFYVRVPTAPEKGAALADAVHAMYADFAASGPSDEEMDVAKRQMANQIAEQSATPSYWLGVLSVLDYRGRDLDRIVGAPEAYRKITGAEVHEAFAKRYVPEARFRFVVTPTGKTAAPVATSPEDDGDK